VFNLVRIGLNQVIQL